MGMNGREGGIDEDPEQYSKYFTDGSLLCLPRILRAMGERMEHVDRKAGAVPDW